ncbi:hypothetical protein CJ030_MR4G004747 [Morella rubra]|uniref:Uncharacterized protein n=1 Tax=Morella rubra TaxID=262757 RepID=A0A6A1VS24_9ROSI|nr:hypothetical protein CJ030_MR4G004747 [Morella rubra]
MGGWVFDLRFLAPPLITLIRTALISQDKLGIETLGHPAVAMSLAIVLALLFLSISIKLPLTMEPIRLRVGDFSGFITVSFFVSIICPSSLFWLSFSMILAVSFWDTMIWDMLKHFMNWFIHTLRSLPILIILCITQHQNASAPSPPQVEAEVV